MVVSEDTGWMGLSGRWISCCDLKEACTRSEGAWDE
jgi:hypothetical protein